jgi:purine-binding chemotaxis protein CheW
MDQEKEKKEDSEINIHNNIAQPKSVVNGVLNREKRPEDKIVPTKQLVTFELDKEEYASIITDLREVINIPEIVAIPGGPDFIAGILNLRGQIVVVIDLEKRFNLKKDNKIKPRHIIIAEVGDNIFGLIVDEVTGVLRVPEASIKPTPPLVTSKIKADYLGGVVVLEGREVDKGDRGEKGDNDPAKVVLETPTNLSNKSNEKTLSETKPEKENSSKEKNRQGPRLIILLDIPKMLSERELMEFGNFVKESTNPADLASSNDSARPTRGV